MWDFDLCDMFDLFTRQAESKQKGITRREIDYNADGHDTGLMFN